MDNEKNYQSSEETTEVVSKSSADILKEVVESSKEKKDSEENKEKAADKKKDKKSGKKFNGKKLKHGTMATVFSCIFIALLVLVNVITTILFERYPITIDLTSEKIYSVTEETENYVKSVDTDVLVTIFADEETFTNYNSYNKQAVELLKNYCKLNHHISYRFLDIDSNPEVVKNYSDSVEQFDIIFETNNKVDGETVQRTRKLGMLDLVSFNDEFTTNLAQSGYSVEMLAEQAGSDLAVLYYYGSYVDSSNAEQAFTSALMTVTDPNPVYVTFLEGRDEIAELEYFKTLLTANGYNLNSIDITSEDIPENTDIVVVPAPKTDYLPEEVNKLSDFLNNDGDLGKQMIYIASYSQEETPNLEEFLNEYGLSIGEGVICETYQSNYYNYQFATIADNFSDYFTQDMESTSPVVYSEYTRPVNVLFDEDGKVGTEKCILSTDNAFTANVSMFQLSSKLSKGQQCYFAMGSKAKFLNDSEGTTVYSNLLCFGSETMFNSSVLSAQQFQNREYLLSMINGVTHKTDGITITPKTITGNVFDINEQQKTVLKWTFCLIIPAVVLIVGVVVWLRRKNR